MISVEELVKIIDTASDATLKSKVGQKCVGGDCNGMCAMTYVNVLQTLLRKEVIEKEEWQG